MYLLRTKTLGIGCISPLKPGVGVPVAAPPRPQLSFGEAPESGAPSKPPARPGLLKKFLCLVGLPLATLTAGYHWGAGTRINPGSELVSQPQGVSDQAPKTEDLPGAFPPIEPYRTRMLQVSPLHQIYVEESGNPNGYPVIYLHGGPGSGMDEDYRRFFDPKFFRIIGFDQRGAQRSLPLGELRENTTWDLVEDIEKIREALGIKGKALIFGGSWGSLLGLAYAETHPENVSGLILRGISLGRLQDTGWSVRPGEGVYNFFPEAGEMLRRPIKDIPLSEEDIRLGRDPCLGAYYRLLTDPDVPETTKLEAIRDSVQSDRMMSGGAPEEHEPDPLEVYREYLPTTLMVLHYYYHNGFMEPSDQLLRDVHKLKDIPQINIVNGRKDRKTPPIRAYTLHLALKEAGIPSQLNIVEEAYHSAWDPPVAEVLLWAVRNFQERVQQEVP